MENEMKRKMCAFEDYGLSFNNRPFSSILNQFISTITKAFYPHSIKNRYNDRCGASKWINYSVSRNIL